MRLQKRLAGGLLKCPPTRVRFDPGRLSDIKEAITKEDIRALISEGAIRKIPKRGISGVRIAKRKEQLKKGRRKGKGKRKGKETSRLNRKRAWINRIRLQRKLLGSLRENGAITKQTFNSLYMKSKGGFFRSRRHLKVYIDEQKLAVKK